MNKNDNSWIKLTKNLEQYRIATTSITRIPPNTNKKKSCKNTVILIGLAHGNEPAGTWFIGDLIEKIYTKQWVIPNNINLSVIPILDEKVAMINSNWFSPKFDYKQYLKNNYILPVYLQKEFSYSLDTRSSLTQESCISNPLMDLINTGENRNLIISIHQTPSISGGYFYTNICNKILYKNLSESFLQYNIPLETCPPGENLKQNYPGIFGVFHKKNLGYYHLQFNPGECSQTFFSKKIKCPFLVCEIPFAYSKLLCSSEIIKIPNEFLEKLLLLHNDINIIYQIIDNIKTNLCSQFINQHTDNYLVSAIYWLNSCKHSYDKMKPFIESKFNGFSSTNQQLIALVRYLFYMVSYIGMLTNCKNQKLRSIALETLYKAYDFFDYSLPIFSINWINSETSNAILMNVLNIISGDI